MIGILFLRFILIVAVLICFLLLFPVFLGRFFCEVTIVLDLLVPHMATSQICQDGRLRGIQFQQRPLNNHWESGCFTTKKRKSWAGSPYDSEGLLHQTCTGGIHLWTQHLQTLVVKKKPHIRLSSNGRKNASNWSGINLDVVDVISKVIIFPSRTLDNARLVVACCLTRTHGHVGEYLGVTWDPMTLWHSERGFAVFVIFLWWQVTRWCLY